MSCWGALSALGVSTCPIVFEQQSQPCWQVQGCVFICSVVGYAMGRAPGDCRQLACLCQSTSNANLLHCVWCLQVLSMRISSLEVDTDVQAKIIWTMKQLGWRDEGLEKILSGLIPNLSELL